MNTKLLIVDDHELIINGIKNMLAAYPRYQIVGQAENGLDVYNLCRQTEPDIAIIDLGLPVWMVLTLLFNFFAAGPP